MKKLIEQQKHDLAKLATLPDEKIDTSKISKVIDWSNTERGELYSSDKQKNINNL